MFCFPACITDRGQVWLIAAGLAHLAFGVGLSPAVNEVVSWAAGAAWEFPGVGDGWAAAWPLSSAPLQRPSAAEATPGELGCHRGKAGAVTVSPHTSVGPDAKLALVFSLLGVGIYGYSKQRAMTARQLGCFEIQWEKACRAKRESFRFVCLSRSPLEESSYQLRGVPLILLHLLRPERGRTHAMWCGGGGGRKRRHVRLFFRKPLEKQVKNSLIL